MDQKHYAEAAAKFEASMKEDPSAGTLLNLAHAHELSGKTATAWAEYKQAQVLADNAHRADVSQLARDYAAKLEPTLSRVQIDVPADVPGIVVEKDGEQVQAGAFGVPIAVDPGEHTIAAHADGFQAWSTKITAGKDVLKVAVPKLEKAPAGANAAVGAGDDSARTRRTLGFIGVGTGVLGFAVGAIVGGLAVSKVSKTNGDPTLCSAKTCNAAGTDAQHSAATLAHVSTVGFVVGGVALATGVVLIATSKGGKKKEAPSAARVVPVVGPGGGALAVIGRF
jgi:hypothetical protein